MECALSVSEYTDRVDISTYNSSQRGIAKNLSELLSIVAGLSVAGDYRLGETLKDKSFGSYAPFFQHMFEGLFLLLSFLICYNSIHFFFSSLQLHAVIKSPTRIK